MNLNKGGELLGWLLIIGAIVAACAFVIYAAVTMP